MGGHVKVAMSFLPRRPKRWRRLAHDRSPCGLCLRCGSVPARTSRQHRRHAGQDGSVAVGWAAEGPAQRKAIEEKAQSVRLELRESRGRLVLGYPGSIDQGERNDLGHGWPGSSGLASTGSCTCSGLGLSFHMRFSRFQRMATRLTRQRLPRLKRGAAMSGNRPDRVPVCASMLGTYLSTTFGTIVISLAPPIASAIASMRRLAQGKRTAARWGRRISRFQATKARALKRSAPGKESSDKAAADGLPRTFNID